MTGFPSQPLKVFMSQTILNGLCLGLLVSQAQAQLPLLDASPRVVPLAPALAGTTGFPDIFETISADIDGSVDQDVISRFDGGLLVSMNVVLSNTTLRIDMPITGLVKGPVSVDRDVLIVSGPAGLSALEFDYTELTQQLSYLNPTVTDLGARNLSQLAYVTSSSTEPNFIIGVASNGTSLVRLDESSGIVGGFVIDPVFTVTTNGTIFDLCVLDFDGDGEPDVAMATSWGLEVVDHQGAAVFSHALAKASGSIAPVHSGAQVGVAWAMPSVGAGSELQFFTNTGYLGVLGLGPGSVASLTSGDFDASGGSDGFSDLVICFSDSSRVLVAANVAGMFSAANTMFLLNGFSAAMGNQTNALIADLDGDGAVDFAWPDRANQTLSVFYNHLWTGHEHTKPGVKYLSGGDPGILGFRYSPPPELTAHFPSDANGFLIRTYNQFDSPTGSWLAPGMVETGPFFTSRTDLMGTNLKVANDTFPLLPAGLWGLPLDEFVTYVEFRYVTIAPNNRTTKKFPPFRFVVHQDGNQDQIAYLLAENPGAELFHEDLIGNGDQGGVGGIRPPDIPPPPVVVNPGP